MATRPEDLEPAATEPDRRFSPAQIALAILAALLVLLLIWFLFLRTGDEDAEVSAPAAPAPTVSPEEEEEAEAPRRRRPVETFEVFAPKDPFDPLISASAGTTGGDTSGTTDDGTTDDGTTDDGATTTTDGTGNTGTTTTTTNSSGNGGENVGGHRVRVIDVFEEGGNGRAQVQVDGTVYTVDEGDRFARTFQLLSTSEECATMLHGDDEFTLCEGEEILK